MDMANHGFLGRRESPVKPLEACLADALQQGAWRVSATRSLAEDLRAGLQGSGAATSGALVVETDAALDSELFLAGPGRKKSGERRRQILAGLVDLLENGKDERITTASLARHLQLSEAALYRHFDSKTQILESLVVLIEDTLFEQVGQLDSHFRRRDSHVYQHAASLVAMLLRFAETNPGVSRVMAGDALVLEDEFLRLRMSEFFSRFEERLAGVLQGRADVGHVGTSAPVLASALSAFCVGRLLGFARSGFRNRPSRELNACLATMLR